MFFGFLSVAVIARFFSRAEYGIFSLALTVLSVALVIATMPGDILFMIYSMIRKK